MLKPYKPKNPLFAEFHKIEERQLPMFIGVYLGIKPLMDTFVSLENFFRLRSLCAKEGILVEHNNVMATPPGESFLRQKERIRNLGTTKLIARPFSENHSQALVHTFISRNIEYVREAQRLTWYNLFVGGDQLLQPAIDNFRYGSTLGFPECCVRFYAAHNGRCFDGKVNWGWNTPFEVYKNSNKPFSKYCNHITMDKTYFLIHHYPCNYNCPATIDLASKLLEGIRNLEPEYAELIDYYLTRPYLVFEEKRAFIFEGEATENEIRYRQCRFIGDNRDSRDYCEIFQGNRITVKDEQVEVFQNNRLLARYPLENNFRGKIYRFE